MRLSDYIQGLRKGKEAHRLEKESMKDPFLADAIDGYNQVEGNHEQRIEQLRIQISAPFYKEKKYLRYHLECCRLSGDRIRNQQLFPVPERDTRACHSDNSTKGNRTSSHKDKDGFHSYFPSLHETSG